MWNIIIIFIILAIGIMIGSSDLVPKKFIKHNDRFSVIAVLALLFVMGISIGINKGIISNIDVIGWNGLLYALFSVFFSIIFVYLFTTVLLRSRQK